MGNYRFEQVLTVSRSIAASSTIYVLALALGTGLLGGCVAPAYERGYYPPQQYYQPYPYNRQPTTEYPSRPLPPPVPFPESRPEPTPDSTPETGPIPLIEMPAPESTVPDRPPESTAPPSAPAPEPAPAVRAPSTSGPGSNVPLEGFRPMRGQTRPTP